LTAGVSSHLPSVFHRNLCARKSSLLYMPLPISSMTAIANLLVVRDVDRSAPSVTIHDPRRSKICEDL